ncbi:glycoside hydrolase family 36 protein [Acholeplasma granularum]|uniref:glycoside hydrolase family 36 protein n=1 Tax=Acholeplasma granularum TaxID=264635 RepID=UPI00046EFEB9|nr:alpha-galactosidase [Acholeplasma granularum]
MKINFKNLTFNISNDVITLKRIGNIINNKSFPFLDIHIAGENKDRNLGIKTDNSSEGSRLKYQSHIQEKDKFIVTQKSNQIEVTSYFYTYPNTNAISVQTSVKNISNNFIIIEEVSTLKVNGFEDIAPEKIYFTRFTQSHHGECQPVRHSFADFGLYGTTGASQKRIAFANVGSWSTKEEIPQGIIEYDDTFVMFQIESNNSWYYEISDKDKAYYLSLGGPNITNGSWYKRLEINECYMTPYAVVSFGDSLNEVVGEMSKYRRHIKGVCEADENLPTIFNEYMHLSWDSPSEDKTRIYAPVISKLGIEYYVVDCGWHNEEDGNIIYPYVGQWKESNKRFPNGVKKTADYIHSLGMKFGLWIEPEIIGIKCADMLNYYDDDCFITRFGKKISVMNRYFLDFRNKKVQLYLTQSIKRMVEEYGADYIKLDYNEDLGIGTDKDSDSFGEGLEQCANAYLSWIDKIRQMFPQVIFETCSSGGMRLDYNTLRHFPIVSTSDQISYKKYPYIVGNILSTVLPEQAAVWSYPVGLPNMEFNPTRAWVESNISDEQVIMNMINSFLGRIHLASHLELLSDNKLDLVKQGITYYKKLSSIKKDALPYFPIGFTRFKEQMVASGLKKDDRIYLAVYNLDGSNHKEIVLRNNIKTIHIAYPNKCDEVKVSFDKNIVKIDFTLDYQARFLEIELND